jgi:hypothetical protein
MFSDAAAELNDCSHDNNLMIKRPAWTAFKNVEKVGEIEGDLTAKDTTRQAWRQ